MIYITQLIYIVEGQEDIFDQFESVAIPIITKYNGELLTRIRPKHENVIEGEWDMPYEIHLVRFPSKADYDNFCKDEWCRKSKFPQKLRYTCNMMYVGLSLHIYSETASN